MATKDMFFWHSYVIIFVVIASWVDVLLGRVQHFRWAWPVLWMCIAPLLKLSSLISMHQPPTHRSNLPTLYALAH